MNEIERYIRNLLSSIFNRIRFTAEAAADRRVRSIVDRQMDKHDNTKRKEP